MNEEPTREDDERFRLRHMQYYLRFAQTYAADNETLEADRADIMQALRVAYKLCQSDSASDDLFKLLIDTVNRFARFLGFRGDLSGRVEWGKKALEVAERLGDDTAIAELCASTIAWPLLQQGDHEQARVYCERGLQVALQCGTPRWAGEAARSLFGIARDLGQVHEAKYWGIKAFQYARRAHDSRLKGSAIFDLGYASMIAHDYERAEKRFRIALELAKREGNKERIANRLGDVGHALFNQGRYEEARYLYEEAMAIAQEIESDVIIAESEFCLAAIEVVYGNTSRADVLTLSARDRFKKLGIIRPGRCEQFVFITAKSLEERTEQSPPA